ncbi:hypothetical protein DRJ16_06575 [Candidatus Woesearchaeota archaeon]|nr:MAG: hypothetical protein DRJ16_06575 [Candidatus Woesearchaeota archaeon]
MANVSDDNNNTGLGYLNLRTSSLDGGGNTGSGGLPPVEETCNCTEWVDVGCGPTGECAPGEMYQTRTCTPAGCSNESQCITSIQCIELEKSFNFTVDRTDADVFRGQNVTIIGTAYNTGNISLIINLSIDSGNLSVFAPESFNLSEASSLDIPIIIHTSLTQELGVYFVTITAKAYGIENNKTIRLDVKENPLIEKLNKLKKQLNGLKSSIVEYSETGVNVQNIEEIAKNTEELLQNAAQSIEEDRIAELRSQLETATNNINKAVAELSALSVQKFIFENKWWIITGIIIIIILSYLSTEIIMPYYRLSKEIKKLRTKEKTQVQGRIATEKNFFMGKMTEEAFNKLLMEKQAKILDTRGAIREKVKERTELIKSKLTFNAVKNWFRSGFSRIVRRLKKVKSYKPKKPK